ncbi:MAG TPA: FAD-dependent oxidoreductase [Bordetella sp.]|jgi:3-phenylpropionate/trans-cinnamate dioxygenase ferredoxin reductase subunit|nr:FAD-dependent oxidoreductase [Bordetella sp.]
MPSTRHVAIIGAGQAAARAIAALRDAGYDGRITLYGEETELPYERPPLSKEALFGAAGIAPATIYDDAFYRSNGVELALGVRIARLDPATGRIHADTGEGIQADRILLATGARARPCAIPGVDADRVLTLRNLADARRLRARLASTQRLVLLGGGFIGLEIAAGAARLGCAVTVIEAKPRLIERAVSAEVSATVHALHASHGVTIKTSSGIVRARQGHAETELLLDDGSTCAGDLIVAGVGAQPNAELAREAGLACDNGIEVDRDCRTRSAIVWAAGDVAWRPHAFLGGAARLESWDNAEIHGDRAGRAIAASFGAPAPADTPDAPPWFWTDQYDLNLQIVGCVTDSDRMVTRGGARDTGPVIFHFRGSRLRGAELLSAGRDRSPVRRLVQQGWSGMPDRLGDTGVSLKELLNQAREVAGAAQGEKQ